MIFINHPVYATYTNVNNKQKNKIRNTCKWILYKPIYIIYMEQFLRLYIHLYSTQPPFHACFVWIFVILFLLTLLNILSRWHVTWINKVIYTNILKLFIVYRHTFCASDVSILWFRFFFQFVYWTCVFLYLSNVQSFIYVNFVNLTELNANNEKQNMYRERMVECCFVEYNRRSSFIQQKQTRIERNCSENK